MVELYVVLGTSGTMQVGNAYVSNVISIVFKLYMFFTWKENIKIYLIHQLACAVGYTGNNCDTKCTFPSYGHDCQMTCVCQKEDCNFAKGCSRSLEGIINLNFKHVLQLFVSKEKYFF